MTFDEMANKDELWFSLPVCNKSRMQERRLHNEAIENDDVLHLTKL